MTHTYRAVARYSSELALTTAFYIKRIIESYSLLIDKLQVFWQELAIVKNPYAIAVSIYDLVAYGGRKKYYERYPRRKSYSNSRRKAHGAILSPFLLNFYPNDRK